MGPKGILNGSSQAQPCTQGWSKCGRWRWGHTAWGDLVPVAEHRPGFGKGKGPHPAALMLSFCTPMRPPEQQGLRSHRRHLERVFRHMKQRGPGRGVAPPFLECTLTRACRQDRCPASGKQQSCEHPSGTGIQGFSFVSGARYGLLATQRSFRRRCRDHPSQTMGLDEGEERGAQH